MEEWNIKVETQWNIEAIICSIVFFIIGLIIGFVVC